ncbi:MAG: DUF721 domain-containing protein [Candidatus Xiphinematobacter sp.]|nr:MAG: DUF721 domain-containing protein [Candidatus Xiphinematobacter sp.]
MLIRLRQNNLKGQEGGLRDVEVVGGLQPRERRGLRVVPEQRGYLQGSKGPTSGRGRPKTLHTIGEALEVLLQRLELDKHLRDRRLREEAVFRSWQEIVGGFFANYSTPLRLRAGILYVRVHQPSIRYELDRTWKSQLLTKLQGKFGRRLIREIRF